MAKEYKHRVVYDAVKDWVNTHTDYESCRPNNFTVVFPSKCNGCEEAIREIRDVMAKKLGGSTQWDTFGCWYDEKGKRECEDGTTIVSAHNCMNKETAREIGKVISDAAERTKQTTVYISTTDHAFIVPRGMLR